MSDDQTIAWFDIAGIGRSPARFDFAKLENLNAHYMRQRSDADLLATLIDELPHLVGGDAFRAKLDPDRLHRLREAMPLLKERAQTLVELTERAAFIVTDRPIAIEEKAGALLDADARAMLGRLSAPISKVEDWSVAPLEDAVKAFAADEGLKLGNVAQPLRAALTGSTASPGIFEVLSILGRSESLGRIADQSSTTSA